MVDLFIIWFLLICIGYDLPRGHLLKELTKPFNRLVRYIGLTHSWQLFAPNPPTASTKLVGLIFMQNGETIRWGGRFLTRHSWLQCWLLTRHRKFETNIAFTRNQDLLQGYCELLTRRYRAAGFEPARIELGRAQTKLFYPGTEPEEPVSEERTLICTYVVTTQEFCLGVPASETDEPGPLKIAA